MFHIVIFFIYKMVPTKTPIILYAQIRLFLYTFMIDSNYRTQ